MLPIRIPLSIETQASVCPLRKFRSVGQYSPSAASRDGPFHIEFAHQILDLSSCALAMTDSFAICAISVIGRSTCISGSQTQIGVALIVFLVHLLIGGILVAKSGLSGPQ